MNMELTWPEDRAPVDRWENVGGVERWASAAIGAGLLFASMAKRDRAGVVAAVAGGAFLFRGVSGHCPVNSAMGRNTAHADTREALGGRRGVHVKESITIGRPLDELYRFWRNLENLPRFMEHLESVRVTGTDRSHWIARGPAGARVEWDAEIINEVENQVIGWRSLPGSTVASAGSVNFDDAGADRGTRITVHLQYDPPAGKLGAMFAKLFGEEPSQQVREDLRRLKRLLEAGEVPSIEGQTSGRAPERRSANRRSA
ncbi:MAG: SRPBCC family protein [Acidobacteriota bacterium]